MRLIHAHFMCQRLRQLEQSYAVLPHRVPRELIEKPADDVTQRVAAERVAGEQRHVEREHQRADADAELHAARAVGEPERLPHVARQEEQEQHRDVQEVAVDVLQDEREGPLAQIALPRLADGAVRRIGPERLVVRAAVVVAGDPEQPGKRQDDQRRRERQRTPATTRASAPNHACGESPKISGE